MSRESNTHRDVALCCTAIGAQRCYRFTKQTDDRESLNVCTKGGLLFFFSPHLVPSALSLARRWTEPQIKDTRPTSIKHLISEGYKRFFLGAECHDDEVLPVDPWINFTRSIVQWDIGSMAEAVWIRQPGVCREAMTAIDRRDQRLSAGEWLSSPQGPSCTSWALNIQEVPHLLHLWVQKPLSYTVMKSDKCFRGIKELK